MINLKSVWLFLLVLLFLSHKEDDMDFKKLHFIKKDVATVLTSYQLKLFIISQRDYGSLNDDEVTTLFSIYKLKYA